MPQINIAIAEDNLLVRQGIIAMFKGHKDFNIVFGVSNGKELLQKMTNVKADVILLGMYMQVMDGKATHAILKNKYPSSKAIILSPNYNNSTVIELISDGISGLLYNNCDIGILMEAIYSVYQKGRYFDSKLTEILASKLGNKEMSDLITKNLTQRQIEIIKLLYDEKNSEEIAGMLYLSRRTVEWHKNQIFEKVGCKTAIGAIKYAIHNGIITI